MSELVFIPKDDIAKVWPLALPLITEGVKHEGTHYSVNGLKDVWESGLWQLWLIWDGKHVLCTLGTELYTDMNGDQVGSVRFVSGKNRKEWVGLIGDLEFQMAAIGVVRLEMMARKGWAKEFPGYHLTHVFLTKDLTNGIRPEDDQRDNPRHNQAADRVPARPTGDNGHSGSSDRVDSRS